MLARLLLIRATGQHLSVLLKHGFQVLVHGEGDGLSGSDTHDARRNTLVEAAGAFLLPHVPGDRLVRVFS